MKKLRRHPQAERDIADAAANYADESINVSNRFLAEVEFALERIRYMPGSGSPRFSRELDMPELCVKSLSKFPYLLFYFDREKSIDLIRVLHSHRDILTLFLQQ